ncbi:LOW QUALITY PROTEIN: hypothetical protein NC653_008979 [Populus alba x Populus x berolinensis]|uniref:Subtilase family protein n=1 Tax=Populus alba x Populus x berolinensis TaxID=444605 RepID=A0AAD6R869_9ROSI|nr:LOW QUALITY PROTEIN: hypothetical protein NC653_008979 [Populus alba x Populus x berolinensis]
MGDLIESSSVTPSTTPHSRPLPIREDCWSEEATSTLVDAWGRRYLELNRGNLRQKDWQDVADAVNALHGHTKKTYRTDVQCKNRIDTIKKKYKIEKSHVVSSNGNLTSSWPFFERLDALIGSNFNSSGKKHLSPSPPVALPLPPSYRRTPQVSSTPPPQPPALAVALPQKRPLPVDDGYFRRNYSAMAAAAAAVESDSEEDEDEEFEGGEKERAEEDVEGEGIKRLALAIERFGEVYERVESEKLKQMVDLEKQRMKFTKDLEMERMRIFTETQVQLEKIKKGIDLLSPTAYLFLWLVFGCRIVLLVVFKKGKKKKKGDAMTWNSEKQDYDQHPKVNQAYRIRSIALLVNSKDKQDGVTKIKLLRLHIANISFTRMENNRSELLPTMKPEEGVSADDLDSWYKSFLPVTIPSSNHQERMVYSYRHVATGFAAKLTAEEAKAMEDKDGFLSAKPQKILSLHTTHSPNFLGLQKNLGFWRNSTYGKGVIVGVLDTGISPDHPSFSDEGVPPPPTKWKGKCNFNGTVCNNKLIVGMAPLAHLAIYKVCSDFGCAESDILAAMDAAVEDGVDVLSLSLGGGSAPFFEDSIAVGAFGATQKGIFILTVGASTIDRSIRADVLLGNSNHFIGESLFQSNSPPFMSLLLLIFMLNLCPEIAQATQHTTQITEKTTLLNYIVHVAKPEGRTLAEFEDLESWYQSFLPVSTASSEKQQRMLYAYQNVMSGFAARLTQEEVKSMEEKDGFLSARPERILHLQTTRTPRFLGLHPELGFWKESNFGKGVIIGVLDGGIFPSHPSFSDEGMPPPPAKWKGRCDFNASDCNNKLIGARPVNIAAKAKKGSAATEPPIDVDGHGTHTASTAAGAFVKDAEVLGNARGTAVGSAPHAHLAIYKVCFGDPGDDCPESDILAGLDAAVLDGVDVLSLSLDGDSVPFFNDTIVIGSFAAIQKEIFVSCSAGNSGPFNGTLCNEAPWIPTVGASTVDRRFAATARLGNGEQIDGESLSQHSNFPSTLLPLVYAGMSGKPNSSLCGEGALEGMDVKGKIVLCERGGGIGRIAKGGEVKNAGGAAMILMNEEADGFSTNADVHVLPATHLCCRAEDQSVYKFNTGTDGNDLFKGTVIGDPSSPFVASFASRGPSLASPGILKPDIVGTGVSILAAWPFPLDNNTNSKSTFKIISGTSMSCPILSGIAALLKSSHPYWSPAAIKSAIMTTADTLNMEGKLIVDQTLQPADIFATGAGHVNPSRANNPGLVYGIQPDDYIPYLRGLVDADNEVSIIVHEQVKCSEKPSIPEGELNYPSFAATLGPSQTFTRTVTNVSPPGVDVTVKPSKLYFSKVNQKATYSVAFSRTEYGGKTSEIAQGYIVWASSKYTVRSPIAVSFK